MARTTHLHQLELRDDSHGMRRGWVELTIKGSAVKAERDGDETEDVLGGLVAAFGGGGVAALVLGGLGGGVVASEEGGGGGGEGEGEEGEESGELHFRGLGIGVEGGWS